MAAVRYNPDEHWADALSSAAFAEFLRGCRWFGGKAQTLRGVQVLEALPLGDAAHLILFQVDYVAAPSETYLLPLNGDNVLHDGLEDEAVRSALLEIIAGEQRLRCGSGELVGICGAGFKGQARPLTSRVLQVEQSNSSVLYDDRYFLKLYRRPELGENPDVELLRYFSERHAFANVPGYCGLIEYRVPGAEPRVLALLVTNVPNAGTVWTSTLDALAGGHDFARAWRLGELTAQMHVALAAEIVDPDFAPEAFTVAYREALGQSMAESTRRMMRLLEEKLEALPVDIRSEAAGLLLREREIRERHAELMEGEIHAMRVRIHGDYHLGQVLDTGSDFVIIDFEGEPARPLNERRIKHSPLRDVASMLRSFDYAAHAAGVQGANLEEWVERVSREFLDGYLNAAEGAAFLPENEEELRTLLDVCLLEKAVYEVCYELNNRPDWAAIPLRGVMRILDRSEGR